MLPSELHSVVGIWTCEHHSWLRAMSHLIIAPAVWGSSPCTTHTQSPPPAVSNVTRTKLVTVGALGTRCPWLRGNSPALWPLYDIDLSRANQKSSFWISVLVLEDEGNVSEWGAGLGSGKPVSRLSFYLARHFQLISVVTPTYNTAPFSRSERSIHQQSTWMVGCKEKHESINLLLFCFFAKQQRSW